MSVYPRPKVAQEDGVIVVTFGSDFKTVHEEYLPGVGEVLMQAAEMDPPLVLIDMAGVEFFSSSFIEILFRLWNRLNKRQGRFVLCEMHPFCRDVLKITNLQSLWTICDSHESALAELRGTSAS